MFFVHAWMARFARCGVAIGAALFAVTAAPGCSGRTAGSGLPPAQTGILHGNLSRDHALGSAPIANHVVQVFSLHGQLVSETRTNDEGWFTFHLPEGKYRVRAELSGIPDTDGGVAESDERVRAGQAGPNVQLVVQSRADWPPDGSAAAHGTLAEATATRTPGPTPSPMPTRKPVDLPAGHGEVWGEVGFHHSAIDYSSVPSHPVLALSTGKVIAKTRTDAEGRFSFVLAAGQYVLSTSFADVGRNLQPQESRVDVAVGAGSRIGRVRLTASDGTRCLPGGTRIATPRGPVPVSELGLGDAILDVHGRERRVLLRQRVSAPAAARAVRLVLVDGRVVTASGLHPLADGRPFATIRAGDTVDGARIVRVESVPLGEDATWDIGTGTPYLADGVPLGSTLEWPADQEKVR